MKLPLPSNKIQRPLRVHLSTEMDSVLGGSLLSVVWYEVAKSIVNRAVEVYGLTEEQAAALRTVFLRPSDYRVTSGLD